MHREWLAAFQRVTGPAHHGPDSRQDFAGRLQLLDEVIRAGFQRDDPIHELGIVGDDDQRSVEQQADRFDHRDRILTQDDLVQQDDIEGLGRELYPELDIWQTAAPILREWMKERASPMVALRQLRRQWPEFVDSLRALPPLLKMAVQNAQDGRMKFGVQPADLARLEAQIRRSQRRRDGALWSAMLGFGAILWLGIEADPPGLATVLMIAAAVTYWRSRRDQDPLP